MLQCLNPCGLPRPVTYLNTGYCWYVHTWQSGLMGSLRQREQNPRKASFSAGLFQPGEVMWAPSILVILCSRAGAEKSPCTVRCWGCQWLLQLRSHSPLVPHDGSTLILISGLYFYFIYSGLFLNFLSFGGCPILSAPAIYMIKIKQGV